MSDIRLVLGDMDGTLVPFGRACVSEATRKAIDVLRGCGVGFGMATGRDPSNAVAYFSGDASYVKTGIFADGKLVLHDGRIVFERALDRDSLTRLGKYLQQFPGCYLLVFQVAGRSPDRPLGDFSEFKSVYSTQSDLLKHGGTSPVSVRAHIVDELPLDPIYAAYVAFCDELGTNESAPQKLKELFPEFDFVVAAPGFCDVMLASWDKASGLGELLGSLGLNVDQVAYFGDSDNDVTMLTSIPLSYAVSGASDRALTAAKTIIGSAEDDAPAQEMLRIACASRQLANGANADWSKGHAVNETEGER